MKEAYSVSCNWLGLVGEAALQHISGLDGAVWCVDLVSLRINVCTKV